MYFITLESLYIFMYHSELLLENRNLIILKGTFTQSILRGVIRRRLGYLINKKMFFLTYKMTILRGEFCPSVNAT